MRVLVVGGGGREHALVWKLAQSPLVSTIYCAPGNAGIAQIAECVSISQVDIDALATFAAANDVGLTVVGPEAPLMAGIVDAFEARGQPIFGPSAEPARIEGSKVFAKDLMRASGIPTADYWTCDSVSAARDCLRAYYAGRSMDSSVVIKADGLAAGKGVIIAAGQEEAMATLDRIMVERVFGGAGDRVVIEERLFGEEASIMAITDGATIVPLIPSQDHKRLLEGDMGSNTGGMGAYAPVPVIPADTVEIVTETILRPAVDAIRDLGIPYRGALYAGVIVTADGPKCIEFNCRLGDPETQAILPLMESDLLPVLLAVTDCTLDQVSIRWKSRAAATVVAVSGGYPEAFETGRQIDGVDRVNQEKECVVFHSGTKWLGDKLVTAGGRVLSVTGVGGTLADALTTSYAALANIHFEGMYFRRDIAARALAVAGRID